MKTLIDYQKSRVFIFFCTAAKEVIFSLSI